MTTSTRPAKPVSAAQRGLISRLLDEKVIDDFNAGELRTELPAMQTTRDASAVIARLMALPSADPQAGTTRVDPTEGLYRVGDDVVRVVVGRSGQWYATIAQKPLEGSGRKSLSWKYLGRRINLKDAVAMDDAEAGRFLTFCVRCGALLSDPDSIARGIGPTCAKRV